MTTTGTLSIGVFAHWMATGERGISSEAIMKHLTGIRDPIRNGAWDHPHDPADLRRCEAMLDAVPLARLCLPQMHTASPVWARLVAEWDSLVALLREEMAEETGRAPRTYARMRSLIDPPSAGLESTP